MSQTYTIKVYKDGVEVGSELVSYLKSETNCAMTKYNVNLNLYDELYNPIVSSTIKIDNINSVLTITNNDNGLVTISDLSRNVEATIESYGYITKTIQLNFLKTNYDVLLKEAKEVISYDSNLEPDGDMENGFTFQSSVGQQFNFTTQEQVTGNYSLEVNSTQGNSYFKHRMNELNTPDKTVFIIVYQIKTKSGIAHIYNGVEYIGNGNNVQNGGSVYPTKAFKTEPIEIGDTWQTVSYTVSLYFDDLSGLIYTSLNGSEYIPHDETSLTVAAADFIFGVVESDTTLYIDNYSAFEVFDANVKVKDENGNNATNATFEIEAPYDNRKPFVPTYDAGTGSYIFKGLYGETKIYAKSGEKEFPVSNVSKLAPNITVSEPFTITVTLKTPKGRLISGAKVVARVGIVTKGTFEEVSDGIYVLENVMETYSIVAIKSGYTFTTQTNVNAKNCTFDIIGEPDEPEEDEGIIEEKGCKGSIISTSILISLISILGIAMLLKKKYLGNNN